MRQARLLLHLQLIFLATVLRLAVEGRDLGMQFVGILWFPEVLGQGLGLPGGTEWA